MLAVLLNNHGNNKTSLLDWGWITIIILCLVYCPTYCRFVIWYTNGFPCHYCLFWRRGVIRGMDTDLYNGQSHNQITISLWWNLSSWFMYNTAFKWHRGKRVIGWRVWSIIAFHMYSLLLSLHGCLCQKLNFAFTLMSIISTWHMRHHRSVFIPNDLYI
jgi:hypothetical protein